MQAYALPPTGPHTYLEALQLGQPVHPVPADLPALAGQQNTQALLAEARPGAARYLRRAVNAAMPCCASSATALQAIASSASA